MDSLQIIEYLDANLETLKITRHNGPNYSSMYVLLHKNDSRCYLYVKGRQHEDAVPANGRNTRPIVIHPYWLSHRNTINKIGGVHVDWDGNKYYAFKKVNGGYQVNVEEEEDLNGLVNCLQICFVAQA